jgi:hypothetical protein
MRALYRSRLIRTVVLSRLMLPYLRAASRSTTNLRSCGNFPPLEAITSVSGKIELRRQFQAVRVRYGASEYCDGMTRKCIKDPRDGAERIVNCIRRDNSAANSLEPNRRLAKGMVELTAVKVFGGQVPDVVMRTRQLYQGRQRFRVEDVAIVLLRFG